mgnify:CR=1 FL=1
MYNIDKDRIGARDWSSFVEDAAAISEEINYSENEESIIK